MVSVRAGKVLLLVTVMLAVNLTALAGCLLVKTRLNPAVTVDSRAVSNLSGQRQEGPAVTISLVGDIMVHSDQLGAAYDRASGGYSFRGVFDEVRTYLRAADLAVGNLETTLAGRDKRYTGYPRFNTPEEIVAALQEAGFDVLTTANNHCLDRGAAGALKTISSLEAGGIKHTGTSASEEARAEPLIIDLKGIKVAVLAYTYGTNGLPVPEDKAYLVNLLDLEQVREDIGQVRTRGADIVLVSPHCGVEYSRAPGEAEKELAAQLFAAGADIVVGSHSHVLQPMFRPDLVKEPAGLFAAYSLGNFISGQKAPNTDSGVILNLTLAKDPASGRIKLTRADYIPTWVHKYKENGRLRFRVVTVEKAIRDYQLGLDRKLTAGDYIRLQQVWQETTTLLSGPAAPVICHL